MAVNAGQSYQRLRRALRQHSVLRQERFSECHGLNALGATKCEIKSKQNWVFLLDIRKRHSVNRNTLLGHIQSHTLENIKK